MRKIRQGRRHGMLSEALTATTLQKPCKTIQSRWKRTCCSSFVYMATLPDGNSTLNLCSSMFLLWLGSVIANVNTLNMHAKGSVHAFGLSTPQTLSKATEPRIGNVKTLLIEVPPCGWLKFFTDLLEFSVSPKH